MSKALAVIGIALLKTLGILIGAAIIEVPLLFVTAFAYGWLSWFGALLAVSVATVVIIWAVSVRIGVDYIGHIFLLISLDGGVNTFLSEYVSPTTPVAFVVLKVFFFQPFAAVPLFFFLSPIIKDILEKPPKPKQV